MPELFRTFCRSLPGLLAAGLLACGSGLPPLSRTPPPPLDATPLVWRATAPGGGVAHLMGSVHVAREHIHDLGAVADAAWQASDELVVEVDVTLVEPQEVAELTRRYGELAPPRTLRDELPEETWDAVVRYLDSRMLPVDVVSGWKPWFVYYFVFEHELSRAGFEAEMGVDHRYIEAAIANDVPIAALETAASQLEVFDSLPDSLEVVLLQDGLARVDHFAAEADALIEAWRGGSESGLAARLFEPLEDEPKLRVFYDRVFVGRNRKMAARLDEMAGDGKTRFVLVGAGHMVGEEGIPTLLAKRGWQVERIGGNP